MSAQGFNPQQAFGSGGLTINHLGSNPSPIFGPPSPVNFNQAINSGGLGNIQRPPAVLGASTYQPPAPQPQSNGGGGQPASRLQQLQAIGGQRNPAQQTEYNQLLQQMGQAAGQTSAAQIKEAQDQYDILRQKLEGQKPVLQNAYDTGVANVDTSVQQQKDQSATATNNAYNNYLDLQGKNLAAARGAGGYSSAELEEQNRAGRDYGNTTHDIGNQLQTAMQAATTQKAQLASTLQDGMRQIALDENASDFQKADAIQKIQADYSSKIAGINQSVLQFQQQMALYQKQAETYASLYGKTGLAAGTAGYQQPITSLDNSGNTQTQSGSSLYGSFDPSKLQFPTAS